MGCWYRKRKHGQAIGTEYNECFRQWDFIVYWQFFLLRWSSNNKIHFKYNSVSFTNSQHGPAHPLLQQFCRHNLKTEVMIHLLMSLFLKVRIIEKNASLLSPKVIWVFSLLVSFILSSHSKTQMEDRLIIIIILILKVLFYNCRLFKYENEVFTF